MTSIPPSPPIKPWSAYVLTYCPSVDDLPAAVSLCSGSGWRGAYSLERVAEIIPIVAGRLALGGLTMHLLFAAQTELGELFMHLSALPNVECVWASREGVEVAS